MSGVVLQTPASTPIIATSSRYSTTPFQALELVALVIATVLIPSIAIIGLFRLGALKRAEGLPPHIAEWARSQDRKPPS